MVWWKIRLKFSHHFCFELIIINHLQTYHILTITHHTTITVYVSEEYLLLNNGFNMYLIFNNIDNICVRKSLLNRWIVNFRHLSRLLTCHIDHCHPCEWKMRNYVVWILTRSSMFSGDKFWRETRRTAAWLTRNFEKE